MAQQGGDRGLLRRYSNIDHATLHQIDVGFPLDQHHDFFSAHPFGQHCGHDISFIVVGDGNKEIYLIDVFFRQQLLIRGIAIEDDRIL